MSDPLFGATYDVDKVHFDDAPEVIGRACKELRGRKMWLYARWRAPGAEYYIVSGLLGVGRERAMAGGAAPEPDGGVAVELIGGACRLAPADSFMWEDVSRSSRSAPITVNKSILDGVVTDALRRYTSAFGGKSNFLREVRKGHFSSSKLPPMLRTRFDEFAQQP